MVRLIPEEPAFATASERLVWALLRVGLGHDDVLIANLRLTDETKDHEADLLVIMPGFGALVLEVKGSSVWYDEGWIQTVGLPAPSLYLHIRGDLERGSTVSGVPATTKRGPLPGLWYE